MIMKYDDFVEKYNIIMDDLDYIFPFDKQTDNGTYSLTL